MIPSEYMHDCTFVFVNLHLQITLELCCSVGQQKSVHYSDKSALIVTSIPIFCRFDPERFNDEAARKQFTLLGFSGSLECPELRFAYTVATIMLSTLIKKLSLHPVEGQVVEMKYDLVTTPKEEAWITVNKRS